MSASNDPKEGFVFLAKDLSEQERDYLVTMVETRFDEVSNYQEQDMAASKELKNKLKRYYWMKILISPFEYIVTRILFGKKAAQEVVKFRDTFFEQLKKSKLL